MTFRPLAMATAATIAACTLSCDVEDEPPPLEPESIEQRDLSAPYIGVPVLIENIYGSCLMVGGPVPIPFVYEYDCDPDDPNQYFVFNIQNYVGGVGFIYEICRADDLSWCLEHSSLGGNLDLAPDTGGPGLYRQVRIQHDENDMLIEFPHSGLCLRADGQPPSPDVQPCGWFGSDPEQHYRLHLLSEGTCEGRCGDYNSNGLCQCDTECENRGDCCDDKQLLCEGGGGDGSGGDGDGGGGDGGGGDGGGGDGGGGDGGGGDGGGGDGGGSECVPGEQCCEPGPTNANCLLCWPDDQPCP